MTCACAASVPGTRNGRFDARAEREGPSPGASLWHATRGRLEPPDDEPRRHREMHQLLPRLVLATVVVGCASPPTPTPPATPEVIRVVDTEPPFSLVFEVPSSTWRSGEAIEGTVSLRVAEGGPSTVYGSAGGPFMFTYRELNGTRFVEPVADAACGGHPVTPDAPITKPLGKSGRLERERPGRSLPRGVPHRARRAPAGGGMGRDRSGDLQRGLGLRRVLARPHGDDRASRQVTKRATPSLIDGAPSRDTMHLAVWASASSTVRSQ